MTATPIGPIGRTISVCGGQFETHLRETGSGAPVLYLHGAEGPLAGWPPFLETLSASYRVIAPDLPGFGQSTGGERMDTVLDLTIYLQDLLDELGLDRVAIVGHDLGGMAAAELAATADRRVTALILIAPLGLWADDDPILDFYATPRDVLVPLTWHDPDSAAATAVLAQPESDEEARLAGLLRNQNLATSTRFLWPIPDRGLKRRIHRVTQPTLLLWGANDGVVPPSYALRWKSALKDVRVVVTPRAGHFPMLEQPTACTDPALPFLKYHGS